MTFSGVKTYSDPLHIFRGSGPPTPRIYAPEGRQNMLPPLWPWPLTFWPWKCCLSHVT